MPTRSNSSLDDDLLDERDPPTPIEPSGSDRPLNTCRQSLKPYVFTPLDLKFTRKHAKANHGKLSRDDLEDLLYLKVTEAIVYRQQNAKLRVMIERHEDMIENLRHRERVLSKQYHDLQSVHERTLRDIERHPQEPVQVIRHIRNVGLQVYQQELTEGMIPTIDLDEEDKDHRNPFRRSPVRSPTPEVEPVPRPRAKRRAEMENKKKNETRRKRTNGKSFVSLNSTVIDDSDEEERGRKRKRQTRKKKVVEVSDDDDGEFDESMEMRKKKKGDESDEESTRNDSRKAQASTSKSTKKDDPKKSQESSKKKPKESSKNHDKSNPKKAPESAEKSPENDGNSAKENDPRKPQESTSKSSEKSPENDSKSTKENDPKNPQESTRKSTDNDPQETPSNDAFQPPSQPLKNKRKPPQNNNKNPPKKSKIDDFVINENISRPLACSTPMVGVTLPFDLSYPSPAPSPLLPIAPPTPFSSQFVKPGSKKIPPRPRIESVEKTEKGVKVQWNMDEVVGKDYADVKAYEIFACRISGGEKPEWKSVGTPKALLLPMAVHLSELEEGHKFYFAVRAQDELKRFTNCSEPMSWE